MESNSNFWFDVRDILVKALTELEKKSVEMPHYRDKQYCINNRNMLRIEDILLDAISKADAQCFSRLEERSAN